MFKIRMQGQYGGAGDKKLGRVVGDMWRDFGLRDGIMRGYWVSCYILCHPNFTHQLLDPPHAEMEPR